MTAMPQTRTTMTTTASAGPARPSPPPPPAGSPLTRPTPEACLAQWVADRLGLVGDIVVAGCWWTDGSCALRLFDEAQPAQRWRWSGTPGCSDGGVAWETDGDDGSGAGASAWVEVPPDAGPGPAPAWPRVVGRLLRQPHLEALPEPEPRPSPLWPAGTTRRFSAAGHALGGPPLTTPDGGAPGLSLGVATVQERYVRAARGLVAPDRWTLTAAFAAGEAARRRIPADTPVVAGWCAGRLVAVFAPVLVPPPAPQVKRARGRPREVVRP